MANLAGVQTLDAIQNLRPVWLRVPAAMRVSSLSRNVLFRHIKDGSLRSKTYTVPGQKKITRFVHFESLMQLMESLPDRKDS
jgi:hypothetical protein